MSETRPLLDACVQALGGAPRSGQQDMAGEVATTLQRGEALLVQAGTGTGKSLAYLAPVVRRAVAQPGRAVIATATLALQRQLISADVPLVTEEVARSGAGRAEVALLKGWHNYVCKHKLAGGYPIEEPALFTADAATPDAAGGTAVDNVSTADHTPPASLADEVRRLHSWATETTSGDRDDCEPGVNDRAWRQVSVTRQECLGKRCPMLEECFAEQARRSAHEADVVITNHAMLGIAADGHPVLPEHDVLVVDEAHELVDRVTAQGTLELSAGIVERTVRLVGRDGAGKQLANAGESLANYLTDVPAGRLRRVPEELHDQVTALGEAAREASTELRGGEAAAPGELEVAKTALGTLQEVCQRLLSGGVAERRDVLWCERGRHGTETPRLRLAPLDVSAAIATELLADRAAVLTSATLTVGGSFAPTARRLGIDRLSASSSETSATEASTSETSIAKTNAENTTVEASADSTTAEASIQWDGPDQPTSGWRAIDVGSPFDYPRQGILYLAAHLPPPSPHGGSEQADEELVELVRAAGGATLGLFTSHRAAQRAAELLRARIDTPVLCQGEVHLPSLVARFVAEKETTLLGTRSLWQGLDVPGEACRLVVIDRIPFPRPDEPLHAARSEVVATTGGNAFMEVAASHAALLLAQGVGRLIRTSSDRGVVALLDSRLATAAYRNFLLASLPQLWPTSDPVTAREALARLAGDA